MSLENLRMEQNETLNLAKEMRDLNILETEVSEATTAKNAIEGLSDDKLADYITKELQNNGSWISYAKMKSKSFYGFMVQASINAIGKKIGDKKYDENGNESASGKTVIDWMNTNDGIDNRYGGKTSKVVKIVQNYLGIERDGKAGPQYFAYICSALKNDKSYLENFKVEGSDNYNSRFDTSNRNTIDTLIVEENVAERTIFDEYKVKCCDGITLSDSTEQVNNRNIYDIKFSGELAGVNRLSIFRRNEPNGDNYSDHIGFWDSVDKEENRDLAEKILDVEFDKDSKEITLKMKKNIDNSLITNITVGQDIAEKTIFDDKTLKYSKDIIVDTNLNVIPGTDNILGYKVSLPVAYAERLKTRDIYLYKNGNGEVLIGNPIKDSGIADIIEKRIDGNNVIVKLKDGIELNNKEHWADDIEGGISDEVKDFVDKYWGHIALPTTIEGKTTYSSELNTILSDIGQKATLASMMDLDEKFRGNYKLGLASLEFFADKMNSGEFDTSSGNAVFEVHNGNDDYLTYQGGKLVKIGESGPGETFEVDGTNWWDDRRFDSVEGLFAWLRGEKVVTARQNVRESANADLLEWRKRFDDKVISNSSLLGTIGSKGSHQYKTFISLLTLPEKFWGGYKLSEQDVKDFKKGMEKDVFDYKTGSATVFHQESGKFEVDGTGYFSDEQFDNVKSFFTWLHKEV